MIDTGLAMIVGGLIGAYVASVFWKVALDGERDENKQLRYRVGIQSQLIEERWHETPKQRCGQ